MSWVRVPSATPSLHLLTAPQALATGGTARACCNLLENIGAKTEACAFVIELAELGGRRVLAPYEVYS